MREGRRRARELALAMVLTTTACSGGEGRIALRFDIDAEIPAENTWFHLQARDDAGGVLSSIVAASEAAERLQLSLPHGTNRRAFLEIRDGQSSSGSRVLGYGVSDRFDLVLGDNRTVDVAIPVRSVARIERLGVVEANRGVTRTAAVTLRIDANRDDIAQVVVAQDPGLSFGRAVATATAGALRVSYDLDIGCRTLGQCQDGPRSVFVQLVDAEGYPSVTTSTVVQLDAQSPGIVPGSAVIRFETPGALLTPNAAGEGVRVVLSFSLTEVVSSTPTVSLEGSDLPFEFENESLGTWVYSRRIGTEDADGEHRPIVTARDVAGNEGQVALGPTYEVDRSPPPAPALDVAGQIVYTRAPWGDAVDDAPRFAVVGQPGAVEAGVRVLVFDREVLFDAEDQLIASRAGDTKAEADGSFRVDLVPVDRAEVYLLLIDEAGNLHNRTGSRVRDVQWTVPAGSPSGPPTPTTVRAFERLPANLRTDSLDVRVLSGENLLAADQLSVRSQHRLRWNDWLPAPSPSPEERRFGAISYDNARDRTLLFGGRVSGDTVRRDTWEWDGRAWSNFALSGTEPFCDDGSVEGDDPFGLMAFHPGVNETLVVCRQLVPRQVPPLPMGGMDTLAVHGWNGTRWAPVTVQSGDAPTGRNGHAVAYDANRGTLILFGGNSGTYLLPNTGAATAEGDTWALDASPPGSSAPLRWRSLNVSGPPARDRHAMVWDPNSERIFMFGGYGATPSPQGRIALDDLWTFDGQRWEQIPKAGPWPPARGRHSMVYDPVTQTIGVLGGLALEPRGRALTEHEDGYGDAWWWDGQTWTQTPSLRNLPETIGAPTGAGLVAHRHGTHHALVLSATVSDGTVNPAQTYWVGPTAYKDRTPTAVRPEGLLFAHVAFDEAAGELLLFEGGFRFFTSTTAPAQTWSWTETGWRTRVAGPDHPRFGLLRGAVYDPARDATYVVSQGHSELCDAPAVWQLRGDQWTELVTPISPIRFHAGTLMTFNTNTRQVELISYPMTPFGCDLDPNLELRLWSFDGMQWTSLLPSRGTFIGQPAHNFVAEPNRRVIMVDNRGNNFGEGWQTWIQDGPTLTRTDPTNPPWGLSTEMLIARDEGRQRTVFVGADAGSARLWELDGTDWRERPTSGVPPGREMIRNLVEDRRQRRMLVVTSALTRQTVGPVLFLDSNRDARPAVQLTLDLATAGLVDVALTSVEVDSVAGGTGGGGDGAALMAWNAARGAWFEVAAQTASAVAPGALSATLDANTAQQLFVRNPSRMVFAVTSASTVGEVYEDPEVVVDRLLLKVSYRLRN